MEESSLSAFAEKAAGIYVEPDDPQDKNYQRWAGYWVKGDLEKELTGLPEFPAIYKKLQRLPVEAKIISVGKRRIEDEVTRGTRTYAHDAAVYPVTIDAGKNKGVKVGMCFVTPDGEEIYITRVEQNSAGGRIFRSTDDEKADRPDWCIDENGTDTPCPVLKPSLEVTTRVGYFWF